MTQPTIKRTNINLDTSLVKDAATVLGTTETTATIHAALREVVNLAARRRLVQHDFADLTGETLERMRSPRRLG